MAKVYLLLLILCGFAQADQVNCIKWKDIAGETVGTYCKPFQVRAGNGIQFADDGYGKITVSATGVAAGAGGSDTQINFNSAGALSGSSGLTWNNSTSTLTATHISGLDRKPYIDIVRDCGAVGDGVTDDGPAIQACFDLYPGRGFFFPQTIAHNCSYFSGQTLYPKGSGVQIIGQSGSQYLDDTTAGHMGGTEICFPTGITGFWLDIQSPRNAEGGAIRNLVLRGTAAFTSLITPTGINVPSDLPQYTHSISSIQRTSNVLTVSISKIAGVEGLTQQVGSTVKISGVVGDATMNGLCDVASLSGLSAFNGNAATFTCAQNGSDAGPFGAVGTVSLPTTGASTADGIRVCSNFWTIDHVGIIRFERHGINGDSQSGHGCGLPFSDDLIVHDTMTMENGGDGVFCAGVDCNAWYVSGLTSYYNFLYGVEDQSSLGNTHVGSQISNNGHLWAASTTPSTKTISTISRTLTSGSSQVSVVLSSADTNLKLGSCVVIAGVTDSSFNTTSGQCFFVNSYTNSTHYGYEQPGAPANASSSGGTSRMGKFSEVYLSAGVDDGAYKVGTQTPVAQPLLAGDYVEGGQNCKFGATTLSFGGVTPGCAVSAVQDFKGQYITTAGCSGFGGILCSTLGAIVTDRDVAGNLNFRAGSTADQTYTLSFLNHSNGIAWKVLANPSGTLGGTGNYEIRSGNTQTRFIAFGKDASGAGGTTDISSEGSGTAVRFQKNFGGSNAGTGGIEVYSGGASPALVSTIDGAGKGTFNGGLVINNIAAPTASANQIAFGSTTASTVGAAGAASALPANPTGYIIVNIAGTNFKIPYYAN